MRSLITLATISILLSSCVTLVDEDGDGHLGCATFFGFVIGDSLTCEFYDRDASIFQGAPELCDGLDNDLDGTTDEGFDTDGDGYFDASDSGCALAYNGEADCDDADARNFPGNAEACDGADNDCDGSTWAEAGESDADHDDHRTCAGDCRDDRPETHPGAPELCDGFDNDCDGFIPKVEFDGDSDGEPACEDCDDADPANFYGNAEVCDGGDNDCDGLADANDSDTDEDGDGFSVCTDDCDDDNAAVRPGATEVCDGVDNDCDGSADEGFDQDFDLFTSCAGDCNDGNAAFKPGAIEICDGFDNDCNGAPEPLEVDQDADGYLACAECDDAAAWNFPGNEEICDDLDNDCNGALSGEELDDDLDGMTECQGDCEDTNPDSYVGATELCDDLDNDCDGALSGEELDDDADGMTECQGDCDDADPENFPGNEELCDGQDNDCNGEDDVLGYAGSETDGDGDSQSECQGDCDDADSFLNTLDEDSDGFDTCFEGDCDEDSVYGYLSTPVNNTEHTSNWACADLFDNDCDGDKDFADADCSPICTPDTTVPSLVPDPGFDGPLQWVAVASDDAGGNTFGLDTLGFATGQGQGLFVENTQTGLSTDEAVGVSFFAPSGTYSVSFAARAANATAIESVEIWIVNTTEPTISVCAQTFDTNYAWLSYQFSTCCELPTDATYQIILNYGAISSSVTWMIYGVGVYPAL